MRSLHLSKAIALGALALGAAGLSQTASAHPSLKVPSTMEGTNIYSGVVITHGCTAFTPPKPITGTVQFFPTGENSSGKGPGRLPGVNGGAPTPIQGGVFSVRKTTDSGSYEVGTQTNLADEIVSAKGGTTGVTSLAGRFRMVSSHEVFQKVGSVSRVNAAGATEVLGSWGALGKLDPTLYGQTEFRANMSGVWLNKDKCAKSLKVRVPAIDICASDKTGTGKPGLANYWINSQTPKFNAPDAHGIKPADNFWMTFTVNRDLVNNPYPESCANAVKYDVVVTPTFEEIDNWMKIPGQLNN
jgi:hypothetical protein